MKLPPLLLRGMASGDPPFFPWAALGCTCPHPARPPSPPSPGRHAHPLLAAAACRRILYTPCYYTLVSHTSSEVLSSLELGEARWRARVRVTNDWRKETRVYEARAALPCPDPTRPGPTAASRVAPASGTPSPPQFTLGQRCGGRYDGVWYTDHLICDDLDKGSLYGVI